MIRRLRRAIGGLFLLATGLLVLAFAMGWLAMVSTHGVSMEPGYHAGDLVVVARADRYSIGDVASYRDRGTGTTVLHRIIDGDANGFGFRGDNNESVDPDRPTADLLIGREIIRVPKIGRYVTGPRRVVAISVFALIGFVMLLTPARRSRTRDDPLAEPPDGVDEPVAALTAAPRPTRRAAWRFAAIAGIVLVNVGAVGALAAAYVAGPRTVEPPPVPDRQISLGYSARVEPNDTYPDGTLGTGDALFLRFVDGVDVTATYTSDDNVEATVRLRAVLAASNGWRSTIELTDPATGPGTTRISGYVDVASVAAQVQRVAATTGVDVSFTAVTIEAIAEPSGGDPISNELVFNASELSWTLRDDPTVIDSPAGPVVSVNAPVADVTTVATDEGGIPRIWRRYLLVAAFAALVLSVLVWPAPIAKPEPESEAVRVQIGGADLPGGLPTIRLAKASELHAIANRYKQPILERPDGWSAVVTPHSVFWFESEQATPIPIAKADERDEGEVVADEVERLVREVMADATVMRGVNTDLDHLDRQPISLLVGANVIEALRIRTHDTPLPRPVAADRRIVVLDVDLVDVDEVDVDVDEVDLDFCDDDDNEVGVLTDAGATVYGNDLGDDRVDEAAPVVDELVAGDTAATIEQDAWTDAAIADEVMDDAFAWLAAQLDVQHSQAM